MNLIQLKKLSLDAQKLIQKYFCIVSVCFCVSKMFLKKLNFFLFFYFKLIFFGVFKSF